MNLLILFTLFALPGLAGLAAGPKAFAPKSVNDLAEGVEKVYQDYEKFHDDTAKNVVQKISTLKKIKSHLINIFQNDPNELKIIANNFKPIDEFLAPYESVIRDMYVMYQKASIIPADLETSDMKTKIAKLVLAKSQIEEKFGDSVTTYFDLLKQYIEASNLRDFVSTYLTEVATTEEIKSGLTQRNKELKAANGNAEKIKEINIKYKDWIEAAQARDMHELKILLKQGDTYSKVRTGFVSKITKMAENVVATFNRQGNQPPSNPDNIAGDGVQNPTIGGDGSLDLPPTTETGLDTGIDIPVEEKPAKRIFK
eukprot:NODE_552_length_6155_cov_0.827774.p1 type:complete len:312 gc:universal NODE_552_length_6155_cov_0.827774:4874-5809(+)